MFNSLSIHICMMHHFLVVMINEFGEGIKVATNSALHVINFRIFFRGVHFLHPWELKLIQKHDWAGKMVFVLLCRANN